MLRSIIKNSARVKMLAQKEKIRAKIKEIPPEDLETIILAINQGRDIVDYLPPGWLNELKNPTKKGWKEFVSFFNSYADANFLLGLTCEILPEYAVFLKGKETWLEGQIEVLRQRVAS